MKRGLHTSKQCQKLNNFFDRDKIQQKYFVDVKITTPYKREIEVDQNKCVNYLIQSTTSDMLLSSALKVSKILEGKSSFVSFCIHDSIVIDMSYEDKNLVEDILDAFSNTKLGKFKTNMNLGKNFGNMRKIR